MLKATVQHCSFPKVLALSAELEENILFLEVLKKIMKDMGFLFAVLNPKISYMHYILCLYKGKIMTILSQTLLIQRPYFLFDITDSFTNQVSIY